MSNQLVITSGAKVRNLDGVLTGTSGVVSSVGFGTANGVATLDGSGKVPLSQLPASVITYLGTWNASTNTPTLTNGVGDTGDLYICNVAGTVNFGAGPITFAVGDWVIYSGTTWEKSGGASGTVTSVAMTVPTGLSVTGSPITTSGTLAVDLAVGYTIPTTSFLSGLVPYTGATGNVNLGEYGLSGGYLGLDTTPTGTPTSIGTLSWDTTYLTPKVVTGTGATTLQIGQEEVILIHNNTGSTLTDGQVVYVTGSTGELPSVSLADASSETTSAATLGVITETIANGANGFATVSGIVHGLNTLAYNEGDILWLSETAGQFTNVKPISPAHLVLIGYVIKKAGGNGSILVKIQNTQELEECSDVLFTSLANNDILAYESSTDLWKNKTIANVLGYTPANAATYVPYTGATSSLYMGSSNLVSAKSFITSGTSGNGYLKLSNALVAATPEADGVKLSSVGSVDLVISSNTYNSTLVTSGNTANRTYTFPNASGTLALTSDIPSLTGYVPYTGATSNLDLGTRFLYAGAIVNTGGVYLSNYTTLASTVGSGKGGFAFPTVNQTQFWFDNGYSAKFFFAGMSADRTYTFQNASGTIAFTSDIPSLTNYVTLNTLQTITGVKFFDAEASFDSNIVLTGGDFVIGNSGFDTSINTETLTASRSINFPNKSGVVAMTSDIPSLSGYVQGSGTTNYISKFTASGTIGNSMLTDDGTTLQSIGATRSNLYLKAASSSYYSQLAFTNGSNGSFGGISYNNSGQYMQFETNSSEWMRLTSDGKLGIGTTSPSGLFEVSNSGSGVTVGDFLVDAANKNVYVGRLSSTSNDNTNFIVRNRIGSALLYVTGNNGNVGIGTSSPTAALQIAGVSQKIYSNNETTGYAYFQLDNTGGSLTMGIERSTGGGLANGTSAYSGYIGTNNATALAFGTNVTERMRIASNGYTHISNNGTYLNASGTYHEFNQSANDSILELTNRGSAPYGITLRYANAAPAGGTNEFIYCTDSSAARFKVNSNGNTYNVTGVFTSGVSDIRYKEQVVDANSQWNDIKSLRVVNFKFIKDVEENGEDALRHIGFIAQQVEEVSPSLVEEMTDRESQETWKTIKTSIIHTKAIKALQEAMARIEELEAKVSALENKA